MISYLEALQIIRQESPLPQTEKVPLLAALSCISATEITSPMNLPSFRNSAMDGFAVRSTDVTAANTTLRFTQSIAAGDAVSANYDEAVQIMTGAMVPEPYDAVIPVEDTSFTGDNVTFKRPAITGENIRLAGEDVTAGRVVLRTGDKITSERIMLLAALGIAEVEVTKLSTIHILSTGTEITDNAEPLPEGHIYNSNAPFLLARCKEEGFTAHYGGIVADDAAGFEARLRTIPAGSVVVTTGAVSKGIWDFIPESLNRLGAITHFHRVNIRPGKPVLFATLPNGTRFFGLPGNPISAAVGLRFFVLPLLHTAQGLASESPWMARLENRFIKKGSFRQFVKAMLHATEKGELRVAIASGQESFKISPMAEGNAWVMLEENKTEYESGMLVPVFSFAATPSLTVKEESLCQAA